MDIEAGSRLDNKKMLNTARYWQLSKPGYFETGAKPLSELKPDHVLIDFHYCGLCGSDVSTFEGKRNNNYPILLGHEFVAIVNEVGSAVTSFAPGDVVVSDLNFRCGTCSPCYRRESHLCTSGQRGDFSNRGFADCALIHESYLVKAPSSEARAAFAYAEPLSCVLHAYRHAELVPSDKVLVLGAGSLGTCMAMALMHNGQPAFFYDPIGSRLSKIIDCSDLFALPNNSLEPDVIVDLSGSLEGLEHAVRRVRKGGRVVSMSHLDGHGSSDFLLPALTRKDVKFIVSYLNGEKSSLPDALEIIMNTPDDLLDAWTEIVPIGSIQTSFMNRRTSPANKTVFDVRLGVD